MKKQHLSGLPELLTRREAAELLRVNPRTLLRYEQQGLLTPIRLNSRVTRYQQKDLEQFLARASRGTGSEEPNAKRKGAMQ
jgi:hypothetical protein